MKCSHTEGKGHDCVYIEAINKFISHAEKDANKQAKSIDEWNRIFHLEMAKLTTHLRSFYYYRKRAS